MDNELPIASPMHFRIIHREANRWGFQNCSVLHNSGAPITDPNDIKTLYGISHSKVIINLFRINGGKPGYYLANLRDREYYYCGPEPIDVKRKLWELGIGRPEPNYSSN